MLLYLWFVMSVETVELIWSNLQFVFYAKWLICKVNLHVWFFDIVRCTNEALVTLCCIRVSFYCIFVYVLLSLP